MNRLDIDYVYDDCVADDGADDEFHDNNHAHVPNSPMRPGPMGPMVPMGPKGPVGPEAPMGLIIMTTTTTATMMMIMMMMMTMKIDESPEMHQNLEIHTEAKKYINI